MTKVEALRRKERFADIRLANPYIPDRILAQHLGVSTQTIANWAIELDLVDQSKFNYEPAVFNIKK